MQTLPRGDRTSPSGSGQPFGHQPLTSLKYCSFLSARPYAKHCSTVTFLPTPVRSAGGPGHPGPTRPAGRAGHGQERHPEPLTPAGPRGNHSPTPAPTPPTPSAPYMDDRRPIQGRLPVPLPHVDPSSYPETTRSRIPLDPGPLRMPAGDADCRRALRRDRRGLDHRTGGGGGGKPRPTPGKPWARERRAVRPVPAGQAGDPAVHSNGGAWNSPSPEVRSRSSQ